MKLPTGGVYLIVLILSLIDCLPTWHAHVGQEDAHKIKMANWPISRQVVPARGWLKRGLEYIGAERRGKIIYQTMPNTKDIEVEYSILVLKSHENVEI